MLIEKDFKHVSIFIVILKTSQKIKLHKSYIFYYSLPKLIYCTGEVGGVHKAVVGKAAVGVPRVITSLPWQLLKDRKERAK